MSCLADLPELVGFFSYSREDDVDSHGALSLLRTRIQGELRGQLGRTAKTFRLWQDKEAIPSGTMWEMEIKNAVGQATFFIPIITPTVIASPYCRFELESFLAREAALGRDDLVFPILYIEVPAFEDAARRQNDPILSLIARRQYVDWSEFRYLDVNSTEVRRAVGRFCADIRNALNRPWVSPEQRKQQQEATPLVTAEAVQQRQVAEVKRGAEPQARESTAEQDRHHREAEVRPGAKAEERHQIQRMQARLLWPPSGPVLVAGSVGILLVGLIGAWLAFSPTSAPPTPPLAVSPKLGPIATAPIPPTSTPATPAVSTPPKPTSQPGPAAPPPAPVKPPSAATATPPAVISAPPPITPVSGLTVAFGDTIDNVRAAYNIRGAAKTDCAESSPCTMLDAPAEGLTFFFNHDKWLYELRADALFSGSIEGVRIGDALRDVIARLGQPTMKPDKDQYAFVVHGLALWCQVDSTSKVTTIFAFDR